MAIKHTLKQGGYKHVATVGPGLHVLRGADTGKPELWAANKNHASYGLIYGNTHLEFVSSAAGTIQGLLLRAQ